MSTHDDVRQLAAANAADGAARTVATRRAKVLAVIDAIYPNVAGVSPNVIREALDEIRNELQRP